MRKMGRSNVLISGMKGLGVEIGKYFFKSVSSIIYNSVHPLLMCINLCYWCFMS